MSSTARHLKQSKIFQNVSDEILDQLDPAPEMCSLTAGQVLIKQGDAGTDYFHLVSGRLRVFAA